MLAPLQLIISLQTWGVFYTGSCSADITAAIVGVSNKISDRTGTIQFSPTFNFTAWAPHPCPLLSCAAMLVSLLTAGGHSLSALWLGDHPFLGCFTFGTVEVAWEFPSQTRTQLPQIGVWGGLLSLCLPSALLLLIISPSRMLRHSSFPKKVEIKVATRWTLLCFRTSQASMWYDSLAVFAFLVIRPFSEAANIPADTWNNGCGAAGWGSGSPDRSHSWDSLERSTS